MDSTSGINDTAVRRFFADFQPEHLHEIVHAVNEYTQALAARMNCADLVAQPLLTNHASITGVLLLARVLHAQALATGDPVYAEYENYIYDLRGLEVLP